MASPVDRYVAISRTARICGTLSRAQAAERLAALAEALGEGHTAAAIAARAEQSAGRLSHLVKRIKAAMS